MPHLGPLRKREARRGCEGPGSPDRRAQLPGPTAFNLATHSSRRLSLCSTSCCSGSMIASTHSLLWGFDL